MFDQGEGCPLGARGQPVNVWGDPGTAKCGASRYAGQVRQRSGQVEVFAKIAPMRKRRTGECRAAERAMNHRKHGVSKSVTQDTGVVRFGSRERAD